MACLSPFDSLGLTFSVCVMFSFSSAFFSGNGICNVCEGICSGGGDAHEIGNLVVPLIVYQQFLSSS